MQICFTMLIGSRPQSAQPIRSFGRELKLSLQHQASHCHISHCWQLTDICSFHASCIKNSANTSNGEQIPLSKPAHPPLVKKKRNVHSCCARIGNHRTHVLFSVAFQRQHFPSGVLQIGVCEVALLRNYLRESALSVLLCSVEGSIPQYFPRLASF